MLGCATKNEVAERIFEARATEHARANLELKTSVFDSRATGVLQPRKSPDATPGKPPVGHAKRNSLSLLGLTLHLLMFSVQVAHGCSYFKF
jgi:hypothetical protein